MSWEEELPEIEGTDHVTYFNNWAWDITDYLNEVKESDNLTVEDFVKLWGATSKNEGSRYLNGPNNFTLMKLAKISQGLNKPLIHSAKEYDEIQAKLDKLQDRNKELENLVQKLSSQLELMRSERKLEELESSLDRLLLFRQKIDNTQLSESIKLARLNNKTGKRKFAKIIYKGFESSPLLEDGEVTHSTLENKISSRNTLYWHNKDEE